MHRSELLSLKLLLLAFNWCVNYVKMSLCICHTATAPSMALQDEAHHTPARSYQTVLEKLGFLEEDSKKLLIGVTATAHRQVMEGVFARFASIAQSARVARTASHCPYGPLCCCRRDKALLSDSFDVLAYDLTIGKLMDLGHLSKVETGSD